MSEIPIDSIDDNPFNCRLVYSDKEIGALADSIREKSLLVPIRVRRNGDRYQIVFGHRRVRAVRLLKLKTIRADLVLATDEQMVEMSLTENVLRADLSAYERAKSMFTLSASFGKTYDEIGSLLGFSKSHVGNHMRMLDLFDQQTLAKNLDLISALHQITEHHARVLLRIQDTNARISALNLVIREGLSVRELEIVLRKLNGWFDSSTMSVQADPSPSPEGHMSISTYRSSDADGIRRIIQHTFNLPRSGEFEEFAKLHDFGSSFSIYSFNPPFSRLVGNEAVEKERHWFFLVAPTLKTEIKDMNIQFFGKAALVTVDLEYSNLTNVGERVTGVRGTILLFKKGKNWKIVHEHSSISREPEEAPANLTFARANVRKK